MTVQRFHIIFLLAILISISGLIIRSLSPNRIAKSAQDSAVALSTGKKSPAAGQQRTIGRELPDIVGHEPVQLTPLPLTSFQQPSVSSQLAPVAGPTSRAHVIESFGRLPLAFEINQGQVASDVKFISHGPGHELFLTPNGLTLRVLHSQWEARNKFDLNADTQLPTSEGTNLELGTQNSGLESSLTMRFLNANADPEIVGMDELRAKSNYFIGDNPAKWQTNIPCYAKVEYKNIYPGINLVYYGNQRQLEYDLVISPHADPGVITMQFSDVAEMANSVLRSRERESGRAGEWESGGVGERESGRVGECVIPQSAIHIPHSKQSAFRIPYSEQSQIRNPKSEEASFLWIDDNGDLVLRTAAGDVHLQKPNIYQEVGGVKFLVPGKYVLKSSVNGHQSTVNGHQLSASGESSVRHKVNRSAGQQVKSSILNSQSAIRNPQSEHSAFSEIRNWEVGFQIDSYDTTKPLIIDPTLVYSKTIGGKDPDVANAVAVDSAGNTYIAGFTRSLDFPVANPLQLKLSGPGDGFITKLDPAGNVAYSTYLGGSIDDFIQGIALDASGNIYVAGMTSSSNFPTVNPIQATRRGPTDAFVAKLNSSGSALVYSTYIGGSDREWATAVAVDSAGDAYVTGYTQSADFPVTAGALQTAFGGGTCSRLGGAPCPDAFVTKLNPAGNAFIYSTFLGGNSNENLARADGAVGGIAVDSAGNVYVTGVTSSPNFPTVSPLQRSCNQCSEFSPDVFVAKINPAGSALLYSTFLGGTSTDVGRAIAVDAAGNAYITGATNSRDFPTANGSQPTLASAGSQRDAFVVKIDPTGSALVYSTYLGGGGDDSATSIAVDSPGNVVVAGSTDSPNFPTSNPVQKTGGGAFFKSTDSAANWSSANSGMVSGAAFAIQIDPRTPSTIYVGTGDGVFKSTDGANTWVASSTGLPNPVFGLQVDPGFTKSVFALQIDPANPSTLYAGGDFLGVFKSTDGGQTWAKSGGIDTLVSALAVDPKNPATIYAGTTTNGVFKSTDSGSTWNPINSGLGSKSISALLIDPATATTIYAAASLTGRGVYKTTDGGGTWTLFKNGLPDQDVNGLAFDPTNSSVIYAATSNSSISVVGGIFKSTNGGANWSALLKTQFNTLSVAIDPKNPSVIYLGSGDPGVANGYGIFKSVDGGKTWILAGIARTAIKTLAIDSRTPSTIYAGADGGSDIFIAALTPTGALLTSTYFGGTGLDDAGGMAITSSGNAYIAGRAYSQDFPRAQAKVDSKDSGNEASSLTEQKTVLQDSTTSPPRPRFGFFSDSVTISNADLADIFMFAFGSLKPAVVCPQIGVTGPPSGALTVGKSSAKFFGAQGGEAPYSFSIPSSVPGMSQIGVLPVLAGTPTKEGAFQVNVTATDAKLCSGKGTFELKAKCPEITLVPATIGTLEVKRAGVISFKAQGGTEPYRFDILGNIPGMKPQFFESSVLLQGSPTSGGTFTITVAASDKFQCTGVGAITVTVKPPPEPEIQHLSPSIGPPGTKVTISGTGLDSVTGVDFNGKPATFAVTSDTTIVATVPEGATTGPVGITTSKGRVASEKPFTIAPLGNCEFDFRRCVYIEKEDGTLIDGKCSLPPGVMGSKAYKVITKDGNEGELFRTIAEVFRFVGKEDKTDRTIDFDSFDTVQLGITEGRTCQLKETVEVPAFNLGSGNPIRQNVLSGQGPDNTEIIPADPNLPTITVVNDGAKLTRFSVKLLGTGIVFKEGSSASVRNVDLITNLKGGTAIQSDKRQNLLIENSNITNPALGIEVKNGSEIQISKVTIQNPGSDGFNFSDVKTCFLKEVSIKNAGRDGGRITGAKKVQISQLEVDPYLEVGLRIKNSNLVQISDSKILNSTIGDSWVFTTNWGLELSSVDAFIVGPKTNIVNTEKKGLGIRLQNSKGLIWGSSIGKHDVGILVSGDSQLLPDLIWQNTIADNNEAYRVLGSTQRKNFSFPYLHAESLTIFQDNVVFNNTKSGVSLGHFTTDLGGGFPASKGGNIFFGNGGFDLVNETGLKISTKNNLWSSADPAEILRKNVSPGAGADVAPVMPAKAIYFAQFAEAPGFTSTLTLTNPSRTDGAATLLAIRNSAGAGANVKLNGNDSPGGLQPGAVAPLGSRSFATDPKTSQVNVGSILATSGRLLAGTVLFSGPAGVAGGGASELLTQFIAPVERSASRTVRTGIAVTNPNTTSAVTVQLQLRDNSTGTVRETSLPLTAGGQAAKFVDELFAGLSNEFAGTLTATSASNVAATVIRTSPGQFATLPVTSAGSKRLLFAQFGEVAGVSSTLTFVNPSLDKTASVTVKIFDDNGAPLTVNLNGSDRPGQFTFSIPAQASVSFASPGSSTTAKIGSVVVDSTENIGGTILFGGSFGLAGVGASQPLSNFIAPVEQTTDGGVITGLAMMNVGASQITVKLTLRDESGIPIQDGSIDVVLKPQGHVAKFIGQFFSTLDLANFRGTITGETSGQIGATVIRQSTLPLEFATLPVAEIAP